MATEYFISDPHHSAEEYQPHLLVDHPAFSAVRSLGPRHLGSECGDSVCVVTNIGSSEFDILQAYSYLAEAIDLARKTTCEHEGSATFASIVTASDGIYFGWGGDTSITLAGKLNNETIVIELTSPHIFTGKSKEGKIITSPFNCLGKFHSGNFHAQYDEFTIEAINEYFDEPPLIIISTDGMFDSIDTEQGLEIHDCHATQQRYLRSLRKEISTKRKDFLKNAIARIEETGISLYSSYFAESLANYARSARSFDDIGIVCSRYGQSMMIAVADAVSATETAGIITSRTFTQCIKDFALRQNDKGHKGIEAKIYSPTTENWGKKLTRPALRSRG